MRLQQRWLVTPLLFLCFCLSFSGNAASKLLVLFDENKEWFDYTWTLQTAKLEIDKHDAFSGEISAKMSSDPENAVYAEAYNGALPGWNYPMKKNPKASEYRYVRFAWKKAGGEGIMIQFNTPGGWDAKSVRYWAGTDKAMKKLAAACALMQNAIKVSEDVPTEWTVVTKDMAEDFDEPVLTGFSHDTMDGGVMHFDYFMIATSEDEFPPIPSSAVSAKGKLATTWSRLKSNYEK